MHFLEETAFRERNQMPVIPIVDESAVVLIAMHVNMQTWEY